MNITLVSNPSDAPGCVKIVADNGQDRLIQTDYDWPGVASVFGWDIKECQSANRALNNEEPCQHENTDGTVNCRCGLTPGDFIYSARQWMDDNDGATTEDPGYFEVEA